MMYNTEFQLLAISAEDLSMPKLKKIKIISSNNVLLEDGYKHMPIQKKINSSEYRKLKKYVLKKIDLQKFSDPEIIITALAWVSVQWEHDGINEPPKKSASYQILQNAAKGERYRCVEYGKVFSDLMRSLGYVSRGVRLQDINVAYGGVGMGHVAAEVWSNSLQKWIFVDPQFGVYVKHDNKFVNFHEMYQLKRNGKFNEISFISGSVLKFSNIKKSKFIKEYKKFIENQFGYLATAYLFADGKIVSLKLPLDGKDLPLTFQGLPCDGNVFTQDVSDFYFSLNKTLIVFNYKESNPVSFMKLFRDKNIKTNKEYMESMPSFAAKPNYKLEFKNNMPWFDYYEVKIDAKLWKKIKGHLFDWTLKKGKNMIEVRGVNKAGLSGITTKIKFAYN